MNQKINNKNIVILGGGFAGVAVAKTLLSNLPEGYTVVLVDKNPSQVFHPALYEVATITFERAPSTRFEYEELLSGATFNFGDIFGRDRKGFSFIQKEVKDVFSLSKEIIFSDGTTTEFEYLVFALGSETNYFGIPHLKENSFPLKNTYDAINIRNQIHEIFQRKQPNQRISMVIGGGGFTGCEFAAELGCWVKKLVVRHPHWSDRVKVTLIEASDKLLPGAKPWIQNAVKKRLESLGVTLIFSQPIRQVVRPNVILKNGAELYFDILIWTAGVIGNPIIEHIADVTLEKGCKILVDEYLRVIPHKNIFGAGDNIFCFDPVGKVQVPATAQGAIIQGKIAGENIRRTIINQTLVRYRAKWPLFVIPSGGKNALSEIFGIRLKGVAGWLLHEAAFLRYFMSLFPFQRAFRIWIDNMRMFSKND